MADLSFTAASVLVESTPTPVYGSGTLGATLVRGDAVYLDSADNKLKGAIATSLAPSRAVGLLLSDGADGQDVFYLVRGWIAGATITKGLVYIVSGATAGKLSPHTDATTPASGEFVTIVGIGQANNILAVNFVWGEVALA